MIKYLLIVTFVFVVKVACADSEQFDFFQGKTTTIKNPFELRDPFKRYPFKRTASSSKKSITTATNGVYSNLPDIENIPLSQIKIVGVLLGTNRRALAKVISEGGGQGSEGINKNTYMLKEGMKLGLDGAELKAILPGGIVVVEKIRNVYDQDEYLETVIPVSSE